MLWRGKAELVVEMVVEAKDKDEARRMMEAHVEEDIKSVGVFACFDAFGLMPVTEVDELPAGWDGDAMPWGGDSCRTCEQVLEEKQ